MQGFERRSPNHLYRNSLVAIFLRKLEYCSAILFLTTNRVSEFDDAILSRIHLPLKYDNLGLEERRSVWQNTLKRADTPHGGACIKDLGSLTAPKLNGWQIKNVVAAAHALAMQGNAPVTDQHIQLALDVSEEFIKEFYRPPERMYS
ncbi:uncharacterized protein Z520_11750 [Fonsecaea multimorphosa CBS 102226]|uniref:ATPase AAA-type core domain-containing protein n=1 Tax=Fonsecaea multimorphosa CBS 102226 TaxID=1442371 RepID=A0A0D2JPY8_9EURO|nr:uncharacterized protein Z520_11750 [Fonsecaea multimorphosa CBS 102226]KIX92574.1 hypothetical protein Z520_11750 [Fonsecaea multimorphosa CBS 102226]OAL17836.1 hypothetical protein AYO22_11263 [Fonsecaea multimorphosa]